MADRTVVVAVDGSDQADKAFKWYCENVYRAGDHVIVVFGAEYKVSFMPGQVSETRLKEIQDEMSKEHQRVEALTNKYVSQLRERNIKGEATPITGKKPEEAIISKAEEVGAAMIVMGTRGLGTIRRTLMGSVSDYIVHHARIPVIVVRDS
ncbi:universal stress protein in QAH/OAS sulfhydrylase 3'region-like [Saccostrea cucullata]|uniref:universal stress protein in QAH/OAS sulfhydrylase 3'region-like n=1 Tax=Saccostrea cuccullata TaxID=36930 RepID=UPI002ED29F10